MFYIAKTRSCEISEIVSIHVEAFPDFFLTKLGKDVLYQFYYYLVNDYNTISYCVKKNGMIIGFVLASFHANGLYKRIFFRGFLNFFPPIFLSFLKNPSLFKRMLISFISTGKHKTPQSQAASILSICVRPDNAGKGIGKMLIDKLENELILHNVDSYYLTTDADNNELTNNFYLKNNFQLYSTFWQGKRSMNLYIKEI